VRPRLADHLRARLHRRGSETSVVISDDRSAGEAVIGLREWRLLACCDGTRDIEGVLLAARQRGTRTSIHELRHFLDQLAAAGMLDEGPLSPPEAPATSTSDGALVPLPGFSLICDGRGTCCRFYDTVTFRPDEVLRARSVAGDVLDCASHPIDAFTPDSGSARTPWRAAAVSLVEGRCAFLEDDGGCRLHRLAGAEAKPAGCRLFPMAIVDDGRALRATPRPECACVFASARVTRQAPHESLHPAAHVAVLGDVAPFRRETYLAWADGRRLPSRDGAGWLRAEAAALDGVATGDEASALARALERRLATRSIGQDIATRAEHGVRIALANRTDAPPGEGEAFYLRAIAHGHLWALDGIALPSSLRRRALVLEIARQLPEHCTGPADSAESEPIALVEALARKVGFLGAAI
jgi:lysine-N-methylase